MKWKTQLLAGCIIAGLLAIVGCSAIGTNPSPPNRAEQYLFDIKT